MDIKLHYNATTTPKIRHYIQNSTKSDSELAQELGISILTVKKWRQRDGVIDRSHTPMKIHRTLSLEQQFLLLYFRQRLGLSIDELLSLTHHFINSKASRAGVSRSLQKYGVSRIDRAERLSLRGVVLLELIKLPKKLALEEDFLLVMIEYASGFIRFSRLDAKLSRQAGIISDFKQHFAQPLKKIWISAQSQYWNVAHTLASEFEVNVEPMPACEQLPQSDDIDFNQDFTELVNGEAIDPRLGLDAQLLSCEYYLNYKLPRGRLNKSTPAAYLQTQ